MSKSFEQAPNPIDPVESAKDAIMTAEQYAEIEHDRPYIFEVESGGKKITYFGSGHSWDPASPVWQELKQKMTEANPDLVLVEGFENLAQKKDRAITEGKKLSEQEAIGKHGDAGFTLKLAVDRGIEFDSPEPTDKECLEALLKQGFSEEAIFAQQFFLMVPQWQQYAKKGDFKEFAQHIIERFKRDTNWDNFDYSYEHIEQLAHKFWGEGINLEDPKYYKDRLDPIPRVDERKDRQTDVNLVSRGFNRIRDEYMIGKIAEYLKTHDRIFIVYGASHAVMQEPALRKLIQSY